MGNTKYRLHKYKAKTNNNIDYFSNLHIINNEIEIPLTDINTILDVSERFNKERQECSLYRIFGNINLICGNILFDVGGDINVPDSLKFLTNEIFRRTDDGVELTPKEAINKFLVNKNEWYGFYNRIKEQQGICEFVEIEPKSARFSLTKDITQDGVEEVDNWYITVTYPYKKDDNNFLVKNGIPIIEKKKVIIGSKVYTSLITPIKNNLSYGDTVRISGSNLDGEYDVIFVGDSNGDNIEHQFSIEVNYDELLIDESTRFVRVINGIPSEYYFRIFKSVNIESGGTIKNKHSETQQLFLNKNVYNDNTYSFYFNEDINIDGLVDNLDRPLSEIYLTIIKTSSNNVFGAVKSGIETIYTESLNSGDINPHIIKIPAINKIHDANSQDDLFQSHEELEKITNSNINALDEFYGDIVEFNKLLCKEIHLEDVYHRFNTINRNLIIDEVLGGARYEGYYYKPHHKVKIRNFSDYIEQGDENTYGMPDYKVEIEGGVYLWRDLLDIGFSELSDNDNLDYPFVNGYHYLFNTHCIEIKRQDPNGLWGLKYKQKNNDEFGDVKSMTTSGNLFIIKSGGNVC